MRLEKDALNTRVAQMHTLAGERKQQADEIAFLQQKFEAAQNERDSLRALVLTLKEVNGRLEQRVEEARAEALAATAALQLQQQHATR